MLQGCRMLAARLQGCRMQGWCCAVGCCRAAGCNGAGCKLQVALGQGWAWVAHRSKTLHCYNYLEVSKSARRRSSGFAGVHHSEEPQCCKYSLLRNSASVPEEGLPGQILAGLPPGKHRDRPAEGRSEVRCRCCPGRSRAKIRPGRPINGPEALLRRASPPSPDPSPESQTHMDQVPVPNWLGLRLGN